MNELTPEAIGAWLADVQTHGVKMGLERIHRALELAGSPQRSYPSLLVGGTNGKGSTVAFASALLSEAGHSVGSTYSPHLSTYRERFVVDGGLASWDELDQLATDLRPIIEGAPGLEGFTFFELGTLLALSHFQRRAVDAAVLEVGMGGEFDASRAAGAQVAGIVSVDLDHCEFLGDNVASIAATKARMAPQGGLMVTTEERRDRLEVIEEETQRAGCQLLRRGRDFDWSMDASGFSYSSKTLNLDGLSLGLKGKHQAQNAACALTLVLAFCERHGLRTPSPWTAGKALEGVRFPGRLERVRLGPGRPTLLLDGAHNPSGAAMLEAELAERRRPERRVWIYAAMADKDREPVQRVLLPHVDRVVCVKGESSPRFAEPSVLAEELSALGVRAEVGTTAKAAATELARKLRSRDEILVAGSLYLVGDVRVALGLLDSP